MSENNIDINNNIQDDDIPKSETNNSNSQDSFNKDLQKKLEEYKKSEPRIPHRPISSYTSKRNFNQVNKEIEQDNNKKSSKTIIKFQINPKVLKQNQIIIQKIQTKKIRVIQMEQVIIIMMN